MANTSKDIGPVLQTAFKFYLLEFLETLDKVSCQTAEDLQRESGGGCSGNESSVNDTNSLLRELGLSPLSKEDPVFELYLTRVPSFTTFTELKVVDKIKKQDELYTEVKKFHKYFVENGDKDGILLSVRGKPSKDILKKIGGCILGRAL